MTNLRIRRLGVIGVFVCLIATSSGGQKNGSAATTPSYLSGPVRFEARTLHREIGNDCRGGPKYDLPACVWIDIRYPEAISAPSPSAMTRINQAIQGWVLEDVGNAGSKETVIVKDQQVLVQEIIDAEKQYRSSDGGFWFERKIEVLYESANVLALRREQDGDLGGAHPHGRIDYLNLRPATGQRIRLEDILKPGFEKPLNAIANARFRADEHLAPQADLKKAGYWFAQNQFQLNDNFSINNKGLNFQYNEYEVSCFACGPPRVFLSFADLQTLLRPDARIP